jgi:hypothetical protein
MGLQHLCDGCNALLAGVPVPHGFVRKTYYCGKCEPSVGRFEKQRDEIHTNLATSWTERLALLRSQWLRDHPDGRLPDE